MTDRDSVARSLTNVMDALKVLAPDLVESDIVNFDVVLPHLFDELPLKRRPTLSYSLGAYRLLVTRYAAASNNVSSIIAELQAHGIDPVSQLTYKRRCTGARRLVGTDLVKSYRNSTRRVFYRQEILAALSSEIGPLKIASVIATVRDLSAFLLFDDDFMDLETDLATNKKTILTRYLSAGGSRLDATRSMLCCLDLSARHSNNAPVSQFARRLFGVYSHL